MRRSLLFASFIAPVLALAQVGANSTCADAIVLPVFSGNVQSSLMTIDGRWFTGAVPSPASPCGENSNQVRSAWYSFTATATKHWIRTEGMGTDDASMEVFSGGCGNLTSVQCFPSAGPMPALNELVVGATYYLRVLMNTNACGPLSPACQVYIAVVSAPVNDECAGAVEMPVVSGTVQAWPTREISSLGSTQSAAACSGTAAASNDDVWYRFTATAGTHFLPSQRMSTAVQDNVFQWYSGTCGNLTSLACDANFVSGLTPGTPYFIRAYSESTDPNITLRTLVDVMAPAPNDECAGAFAMTVAAPGEAPVPVPFTTVNATSSTVPCGTVAHDAWLTFTAPSSSVVVITAEGGTATLFSGSCGSLTCVSSLSGSGYGVTFTGLMPGATYFLSIGGATLSRRNNKVWAFASPTNEDCTTGVEVEVQSEPMTFTHGHLYSDSETAWYHFVATAPSHTIQGYTTAGEGNLALRAKVYNGDCGGLTQVATSGDLSIPLRLNGLVVGQTYQVEMGGISPLAFRFAVGENGLNDDCASAIELPFNSVEDFNSIAQVNNAIAQDGVGGCLPDYDLWYRFTAAHSSVGFLADGPNLFLTASVDAAIELYEGTCGALTPIACVQDRTSGTFTGLVPGNTYFIRWSTRLSVRFRPMLFDQPVNDDVSGALPAPIGSTFAHGGAQYWNFGASQTMTNPVPCAAGGPDDDMWYTFTATATTQGVVARQSNNSFYEEPVFNGFRVIVYDTVTTDLDVLQDHVLACGTSPLTLSGLEEGKQYLYRAFHTELGTICGYVTSATESNNDEPAGAHPLAYTDRYSVAFTTAGATQSMPGAACQTDDHADDDIWFKFTAAAGPARLVIGRADRNVTIELFSGTPGNLTSIACDGNILDLPPLTVGQTYYARVYSWLNATPVNGQLGLIATPSLTANSCVEEDCLGPVLVPNPGIEQGEHCTVHIANVGGTEGLGTSVAPGWPRMQMGSSDGWGSCANYDQRYENPGTPMGLGHIKILSRSGKGMGGLLMADNTGAFGYVEYLQAPLSEPLVPGEPYLISFYAATNPVALCLSGLGAKLSEGPLAMGTYLETIPVVPDVVSLEAICTAEWTNICAIVVPSTAVDHITIGAFQMEGEAVKIGDPIAQSYYVIDDVVVSRIDDPSCITSIGDVPPLEEDTDRGGDNLRVYPNPANDRVNIVSDAGLFGQRAVIEVFDITGKRMHAEEVAWMQALQPLDLPADWKEGLYLVMVRVDGKAPRSARVVLRR